MLLGSACGGGSGNDDPSVVAGFYPLAEVAGRLAGDDVVVHNLTPPGVEPHDLELTTDQADRIEDASLVVLLGGGFQPALEEAAARRDGPTVLVLDALGLEGDPHIWLDPVLMLDVVDELGAALADAFPDDRAAVEDRRRAYRGEVRTLADSYADRLGTCRRDLLVTAHGAFGRLSERFDLRQESIAGLSPEQEPDPRRLGELTDLVREEGVTTIFTEELVSPEVAETLAREAGVTTDVLDPLEGLSADRIDAGETYVSVMERNLERIAAALDCGQP